jgi:hypothetical protein
MSYAIVCTKHCCELSSGDATDHDGLFSIVFRDAVPVYENTGQPVLDPNDVDFMGLLLPNGKYIGEFGFDLSKMWCPENTIDFVMEQPKANIAEWEAAAKEADCAPWYAVIDLDTGGAVEGFEKSMHQNWAYMWEEVSRL